MKQIRFACDLPLRGKNITTALISKSERIVAEECTRLCADWDSCESFFYNTVTGSCQYHDVVFTTAAGATDQEGMEYYYIIKGLNNWCPVEKDFQLLTEDGPCVKFHTDKKTWYEANETCVSYSPNSRLVVLDTQEKNELVKAAGMAINDQFSAAVSIGLSEYDQDTCRWVSGQDVEFIDWGSVDESRLDREDCVCFLRSEGWKWKKTECGPYTRNYICEVDVHIRKYHKMMDYNYEYLYSDGIYTTEHSFLDRDHEALVALRCPRLNSFTFEQFRRQCMGGDPKTILKLLH